MIIIKIVLVIIHKENVLMDVNKSSNNTKKY